MLDIKHGVVMKTVEGYSSSVEKKPRTVQDVYILLNTQLLNEAAIN